MIDPWTRKVLRQRAVDAWNESKRLDRDTARVIVQSEAGVGSSRRARAGRVAHRRNFGDHEIRPMWVGHFSLSITARELEYFADQAIRRCDTGEEDRQAAHGGAGLVASAHDSTMDRLEAAVGTRTGFLAAARDAGTALGLVITAQPDVAVVDSRLDFVNGADLALTVPVYAPHTKVLPLTDDDEVAAVAVVAGVDVLPTSFSDEALRSWLSLSAA